jgi:hypothetical protein
MSSYSVHRSIPPTQGTVPTSFFYPDIPALNRKGRSPDKEPRPFPIHPIAEKEGVLENQASGTTPVLL